MKEITVSESRDIMLNLLRDVADFCDANNLVYYLAYGTLIGAIRHKGFIPWDDDIDIMMPRPDYEKFIELYHKIGRFGISSPFIDKGCFFFYSKVYDDRTLKYEAGIDYNRYTPLGIDIDIFPLDGVPEETLRNKYIKDYLKLIRYGNLLRRARAPRSNSTSIKGRIAAFTINPICRFIGKDFFIKRIIDIATKYKYQSCDRVHVAFPMHENVGEQYEKRLFNNRIKMKFENDEYWIPEGYDEILTSYYGDYMQLPPIQERVTHHVNKICWK